MNGLWFVVIIASFLNMVQGLQLVLHDKRIKELEMRSIEVRPEVEHER